MATMDFCDGDYLGAYRRFLEHFVANVCMEDQLPVKMSRRNVRECELAGEIADITLQHLNQRICPPSLQAYLVRLVTDEFKMLFQKYPEECGYRSQDKTFAPLKLMQAVTNKVNEICQRYLDNSRLALLPPPPSTPLPIASIHATRNKRRRMEDRSIVLHDLHTMFSIKNDAVVNYYAVFDGHGGQECAAYSVAHLHQYLVESPYYPVNPEFALRDAFQTTDKRFIQCDSSQNSGATAVCALLYDKTLYIAWAGDSQAALIKNAKCEILTESHKPGRADETARITALGGAILHFGTWRVNGILNISRSLGDVKHKPFVSEEPDILKIELDGTEDFLVLASDGYWERASEYTTTRLLYTHVNSQHESTSASEVLADFAKQNQSTDNISVIVVYLTPPDEIAAKSLAPYHKRLNMDLPELPDQEDVWDEKYNNFGKQPPLDPNQQLLHSNGSDDALAAACANNSILEPINGRHRPKPLRYDDEDDEEDEEEEEEDVDLGPETNVDMVDDTNEEFAKADQAMGQNYPDEFLVAMNKRENDEFPMEIKKHHQNDLIPEADNVADSEDSEDEWNYYRPTSQENESNSNSGGVDDATTTITTTTTNTTTNTTTTTTTGQSKDPALVEKPDQCQEEKEPCSPKPYEDNNLLDNQPVSSGSIADPEADADDVTAEFDELHELEETRERLPTQDFELKETDTEASATTEEKATIPEEDFPFDKEQQQQPEPVPEPVPEPELQPEAEIQPEQQSVLHTEINETEVKTAEPTEHQPAQHLDGIEDEDQDMESHLNPDAAEFVPTLSPPAINQRMAEMTDLLAGSPLKQSQKALKNRAIPSEEEFQEEVCRRPSEIDTSDFSNGAESPQRDMFGSFDDSKHKTVINQLALDESVISSTRAEFGDESNFSVASELYKTGISTMDCSYTGSERGDFDFNKDAMATSMTPDDFRAAFQEPDLNKVHELNDDDLMGIEQQNGTLLEKEDEDMFVDNEDKELSKEKIDLDFENFVPQQRQSEEVFSAIVEQKESDNKDLFMNLRNTEQGLEQEKQEFRNDFSAEPAEITSSTVNEKLGGFSSDDVPTYASNNPFADDYVPESENNVQNLADDMQNVNLGEPKEPLYYDNHALSPDEEHQVNKPEIPKESLDQVMQNPLDLNFGASAEQKVDEPVLVSPIKEPEVMSSKFAEENLMCQSPDPLRDTQLDAKVSEQNDFFEKTNHVEDFSPLNAQPEENIMDASPLEDLHKDVPEIPKNDELIHEDTGPLKENVEHIFDKVDPIQENFETAALETVFELVPMSVNQFYAEYEQFNEKASEVRENIEETFERKSINLSESLQEFTGLEEQLSPSHGEVKDNIQAQEPQILKENLVDEQKDVEEVTPSPTIEEKIQETPVVTNEAQSLSNEAPENVAAPAIAAAATTAVAAAAVAATAAATAAKPTKTTAAAKPSKPTATSKVGAKSTTPTSPTKTGVTAKPASTLGAKKPATATSAANRAKPATGTAAKTATSTLNKTTAAAKSTLAPKTAASAVTKSTPRTSTTTAASKPKPLSSVTSKISSTTSADKKPTTNGEVKPAPIGRSAPPPKAATAKPPTSTAASKTGLVKSSTTTRSSLGSTTTGATKPRPTSAATTKTATTSKLNSTNVSSTTSSTATARPRTAPASTLNATAKPKTTLGSKSPMIDKQIKETANKQISSARSTTTAAKSRLSTAGTASSTTTTKRTSLAPKPATAAASPAKKPAPITKPGSKLNATSKVNSKVSSTTKSSSTGTATSKVVQNGVCEAQESKIITNTSITTTTTNIEEDIPKKDVSPIEPVTDNQLIIAE